MESRHRRINVVQFKSSMIDGRLAWPLGSEHSNALPPRTIESHERSYSIQIMTTKGGLLLIGIVTTPSPQSEKHSFLSTSIAAENLHRSFHGLYSENYTENQ